MLLVERSLDRIRDHRASGGAAYISVDSASALAAAAASDAARRRGQSGSLLSGLPVSIKDLFDVRGETTSAGSRVLAMAAPAKNDADAVARLRDAGAILLGRTNMSEFGYSGLGLNPHYGSPLNPLDRTRVAGGSTSGGAVSVASGMAVVALGTDTGGSVRIPAAFCGLTGFKPSQHRISMRGAVPASVTLDSAGSLAHSVDCCAIMDAVLSGTEVNIQTVLPSEVRIGICVDYGGNDLDETVAHAFDETVEVLRAAGVSVCKFAFPELAHLTEINRSGGFAAADAAQWHGEMLDDKATLYDPRVEVRIRRGRTITGKDYGAMITKRREMIEAAAKRLAGIDAWLMPTVTMVAPALSPLLDDDAQFFETNAKVVRNPSAINFLNGCALSLPYRRPGCMPVGLSLCGLNGWDQRILALGRMMEGLLPGRASDGKAA